MREIDYLRVVADARSESVRALAALRADKRLSAAINGLPPFSQWKPFEDSDAWVSGFHFRGTGGFALPFYPDDFVYSPVIQVPLDHARGQPHAHYKRGVSKYTKQLEQNKALPPVTILYLPAEGRWIMMDGSHRMAAYYDVKAPFARAVLGIGKSIAKEGP